MTKRRLDPAKVAMAAAQCKVAYLAFAQAWQLVCEAGLGTEASVMARSFDKMRHRAEMFRALAEKLWADQRKAQ